MSAVTIKDKQKLVCHLLNGAIASDLERSHLDFMVSILCNMSLNIVHIQWQTRTK